MVTTVIENTPTYPDTEPGATPVVLWTDPALFQDFPAGAVLNSLEMRLDTLWQNDAGRWDLIKDAAKTAGAPFGYDVLMFAVWEMPLASVQVPMQICIGPICFTPPHAGEAFFTGYQYRVWFLYYHP